MKKKCPECRKTFDDLKFNVCPICIEPLIEIAERSELPKGRKFEVFERDNYSCQICGASRKNGAEITLDHIIPLAAGIINGGTNEINNLQTLCKECNQNKADLIFKNKTQYSIELKQLKITILEKEIKKNKKKLDYTKDENEIIEYSFNIKRLEEQLPVLSKELIELNIKYQQEQDKIKKDKEQQEKQELLFKKLYVNLPPTEILVLKEKFDLNHLSDEDLLKTLCKKYSENEINETIEEYKADLQEFINNSIKFNMLPLISSELSLNSDSKQYIVNHLYKNYTKAQINDLFKSIQEKLFNQYDLSLNNLEKPLLKRYYSLYNSSDDDLINYVIHNDFSIDELKNTVGLSYKNVFQEFYNKLNNNQKELVKFRFKNSKKNLVDFLVNHNFSFNELIDELNKTKIEQFNKKFNSLDTTKKSLIERYYTVYSPDFNFVNYFYENNFSDNKIDELIELSKKSLILEVHNNLNEHELFLLNNTFENNTYLIKFMVEHQYSFKSLRKRLVKREKRMNVELGNTLNDKHKFLLKKYFSINNNSSLIQYLINNKYTIDKSLELANNYYEELYKEFDNNINYDYEKFLYNKISLDVNSKSELIDYLIYENYSVESMKSLIRKDVLQSYSKLLDANSISLLCYKFKLVTANKISPITLKDYLIDNDYTIYSVNQSINAAKLELSDELEKKITPIAEELINKELNLNKSKEDLISYLIENYTVESIRKLLNKHYIDI